jgi:heat-inducible transcriptional repressor
VSCSPRTSSASSSSTSSSCGWTRGASWRSSSAARESCTTASCSSTSRSSELDRIGRLLTEEFCGRTLPRIRALLERRLREERAAYDRFVARSLELGRRTLEAEEARAEVFVDGASNLVYSPEFADPGKSRTLLQALESKRTLIDLLGRVLDGRGVQIVIGDEQPSPDLAGCSLVATTYGSGDRVVGKLGVVGPARMEYAQAIALVDHLGRLLDGIFSKEN